MSLPRRAKLGSVMLFLGIALPGSYFLLVPWSRGEEYYEENGLWLLLVVLVLVGAGLLVSGVILLSISLFKYWRDRKLEAGE